MFLLLTTAAAALASCEFAVSADGRFCCPAWCKTCGGESGECSTATLEEVGRHECGKFAPPCLLVVSHDPVRALSTAGRDVLDLDDVGDASAPTVAPNRSALRLKATTGELPADLNVTAQSTVAVKIEIPDDPNLNSAVGAEVRAHVAAELRSLAAKAQERFVSANAELAAAAAEVNRAREAEEVDLDADGPSIANLSAPPLYARLLPEFPAVQAASKQIFAAGHAWQAHRPGDVETVFNTVMNKSVKAVKAAVRDGRDLADALDEMDRRAGETFAVADRVRNETNLGEVDPGLLNDLNRLRGVAGPKAFVESSTHTSRIRPGELGTLRQAEKRFRDAARRVAEARLEMKTWSGARDAAEALPHGASKTDKDVFWGEQQLETTARAWERAAVRTERVAEREHAALLSAERRQKSAYRVVSKANASLGVILGRANLKLNKATEMLQSAAEDYTHASDIASPSPILNASLHALARSVAFAMSRKRVAEADAKTLDGLQVDSIPVAKAADIANRSAISLAAAATQLRNSVRELEIREADKESDMRSLTLLEARHS
jgi:hypothetical protein